MSGYYKVWPILISLTQDIINKPLINFINGALVGLSKKISYCFLTFGKDFLLDYSLTISNMSQNSKVAEEINIIDFPMCFLAAY